MKIRYPYLDKLKGAAIILVILFHTVNWNSSSHSVVVNSYLLNALMPMLMPTFFGISGFLLYSSKVEKTGSWILDKAKYLLIPHFAIDILWYLFSLVGVNSMAGSIHSLSFPSWLYRSVIRDDRDWFCWAFFFTLLLMLLIKKSDKSRRFWPVLIGLLLIVTLSPGTPDWFHTVHIQWYFPFSVAGYLLARYWSSIKRYATLLAFSGAIAYVPYMFMTGWNGAFVSRPMLDNYYWIADGKPMEGPMVFLQSVFGAGLLISLVYLLSKAKIFSWLTFFGRYSFVFYILQGLVLTAFFFSSSGIGQAVVFVLALASCSGIIVLLRHIRVLARWVPGPLPHSAT